MLPQPQQKTLFKYEGTTNSKYTRGDIYGIYQGKWQRVHTFDEWKMLTAANKLAVFLDCSDDMPDGKTLTDFTPFSMLTYSTAEETKKFNINFIPKNQLLIMKSIFNLTNINRILNIEIDSMEVNGIIYILLTNGIVDENNKLTYYTYQSIDENSMPVNQWKPVLQFDGSAVEYITENQDFGDLTKHKLAQLTREELDLLFANTQELKLGFAFLFKSIGPNLQLRVNEIILNTDVKGQWNSTQLGVDYTYCYPDDSSMTITFKAKGKYKINYFG